MTRFVIGLEVLLIAVITAVAVADQETQTRVDQVAAEQEDRPFDRALANQPPEKRWRFRRHNGRWWYWMPAQYWKFHMDGQWYDYDPATYRQLTAGRRTSEEQRMYRIVDGRQLPKRRIVIEADEEDDGLPDYDFDDGGGTFIFPSCGGRF